MGKKSLEQCRTYNDLCQNVRRNGGELREGGNHTKVYVDGQYVTAFPRHPGDIARGTLKSIIKALAGVGFVGTLIALGIYNLL